jgi:hypothetical protein
MGDFSQVPWVDEIKKRSKTRFKLGRYNKIIPTETVANIALNSFKSS